MTKERNDTSIKLVIDTKVNKVLFAEASKDFAEFLFFLLSLPIATVAKLFNSDLAGIGNLYESFEYLDQTYLQPNMQKNALLNPMSVKPPKPQPMITESSSSSLRFYTCQDSNCKGGVTNVCGGAFCPACFGEMNHGIELVVASSGVLNKENGSKGSVENEQEVVSYIIYDDLTITPMSTTSIAAMMNNLDASNLKERIVKINRKHVLEVLDFSFESTIVLTDVFLGWEPRVEEMEMLSRDFAEEMKGARAILESSQRSKEQNITSWLTSNEVLLNVREELMKGFQTLPYAADVGVKRIGKIDPMPFKVAYAQKGWDWKDHLQLVSYWEGRLSSRDWDPFIMIPKQGKHEEMQLVINKDDSELKELRSEYGDDVYDAVVKALTEKSKYNQGYAVDEVWNFKEGRKASLSEAIQCLFDNLNTLQSSKRNGSM